METRRLSRGGDGGASTTGAAGFRTAEVSTFGRPGAPPEGALLATAEADTRVTLNVGPW